VAWCQTRLHWTKEEWKRVIWTDEFSFSTTGFGHWTWVIRIVDEVSSRLHRQELPFRP